MSEITREQIEQALAGVEDPNTGTNLKEAGAIRGVGIDEDRVSVDLRLGYPAEGARESISGMAREAVEALPGVSSAAVSVSWKIVAHKVQKGLTPLPEVKNVIAVASAKGGVGKSTVAANLALALAAEGAAVGVLDADIYGPSQPRMLGLSGKPDTDGQSIRPMENYGLQVMSIGFLIEEETPTVWRGPMVTSALQQLLSETRWQGLDYLVIDLPPGTGDIQLTLAQKVPVSGSIIVTTPQDIALLDAKRGLRMFQKVGVPVLGIVENMSTHICGNCGHEEHIFGAGGGQQVADQYDVPFLGSLPLDIRIREQVDGGRPTVVAEPDSQIAASYREIARRTAGALATQARNESVRMPKISIE
jgi:ATP-binding protein involved in chromosome partitioning